jgi:hypothetical protein
LSGTITEAGAGEAVAAAGSAAGAAVSAAEGLAGPVAGAPDETTAPRDSCTAEVFHGKVPTPSPSSTRKSRPVPVRNHTRFAPQPDRENPASWSSFCMSDTNGRDRTRNGRTLVPGSFRKD